MILIIDDEVNISETLADILELSGFEVKVAFTGEDGLSVAVKEKPDLILCDVMMPEMSGYEVLEAIRNHHRTMQVPFIFLTAKDHTQDFREGMNLGADDYLTKPVETQTLLSTVKNRLNKHNSLLEVGHMEENTRMNRELHDTLQQTLLGLQMRLTRFRERLTIPANQKEMDESLEYIKLAFKQFRMILEYGNSKMQWEIGFVAGLEQMIQRVSRYVDFKISLHNELQREIPADKASVLFKVLLEVLNNAIKHSRAHKLFIHLTKEGSVVSLVILDDGRGFDMNAVEEGNGLKNIRERIEELPGTLRIDSSVDNGTSIEITFECEFL